MLYLVGTPIGNLREITSYALEILNSVDYIACEDTRTSMVLLNNYQIKKPLVSYHKFNEKEAGTKILEDLKAGKNIAIISDAGMPGISDPGNVLVNMAIEQGLDYTVISGPSALINAFIMSGMDTPFTFVGFLPNKKTDAKKMLDKVKNYESTLIFYVAPHDIDKTFELLNEILGDRRVAVVREISKKFEEKVFTTLAQGYNGVLKGEFVLVIEGKQEDIDTDINIVEEINALLDNGVDKKEAIKQVAHKHGLQKNDVYQEYLKSKK